MDIPGFGRHSADIPEARHSGRREQEKRDKDTLSPADSNHSWHRNYQMSFNPN